MNSCHHRLQILHFFNYFFSRTTLHTLQIPDYKALDEIVSNVKSILVVGGGFLGSELAVGLASRGEQME